MIPNWIIFVSAFQWISFCSISSKRLHAHRLSVRPTVIVVPSSTSSFSPAIRGRNLPATRREKNNSFRIEEACRSIPSEKLLYTGSLSVGLTIPVEFPSFRVSRTRDGEESSGESSLERFAPLLRPSFFPRRLASGLPFFRDGPSDSNKPTA